MKTLKKVIFYNDNSMSSGQILLWVVMIYPVHSLLQTMYMDCNRYSVLGSGIAKTLVLLSPIVKNYRQSRYHSFGGLNY